MASILSSDEVFTYEILHEEAEHEEVVSVVATAFQDEPINSHLCLAVDGFAGLVRQVVRCDALTVIAREKTTGKIAGAAISRDVTEDKSIETPHPPSSSPLTTALDSIHHLLHSLSSPLKEGFAPGEFCHFWFLAVSKDYRGRGLATRLSSAAVDLIRSRGFHGVFAEATALGSQGAFTKLGFDVKNEIVYNDYHEEEAGEGAFPFRGLSGSAKFMTLALDSQGFGSFLQW
eukprot:gene6705-7413_t